MKSKDVRLSFRLNDKTALYLSKLGIIDLRTGRTKPGNKINTSELMNNALITVLESNKNPYKNTMSPEDLMIAWGKYRIEVLKNEIMKIQKEITGE